jgi:uncharacterized protein (DUF433 family)
MATLEPLPAEAPPLRTDENGAVRVGGTRVTLDTVIGAFNSGCSPEEIVLRYPTLHLADVYAVVTYYLNHEEAVDAYVEERRLQAEEMRRRMEIECPTREIRQRILARHDSHSQDTQ